METTTGQPILVDRQEFLQQKTSASHSKWRMDADEAYEHLEQFYSNEVGDGYVADYDTIRHLRAVAEFMTQPQRSFGLALCGTCGNGKTTLMRAVQKMHRALGNRTCSTSTTRIVNHIRAGREIPQEFYNEPFLCIDELCNEPARIPHYGDMLTPVKDLLEHRYANRLFTIVTTNASPSVLEQWYGERVRDRFREMFKKIDFTNASFR